MGAPGSGVLGVSTEEPAAWSRASRAAWSEVEKEWSGVAQIVEWGGVGWCGVEWKRSGVECGVGWKRRVEWSGKEWSGKGVEWSVG